MDTERYPEWNPTFMAVSPTYEPDIQVRSRVGKPNGSFIDMTTTVKSFVVHEELRQSGGLPVVLTYNHGGF